MISFLRDLRHGRFRKFNSVWVFLGRLYQKTIRYVPLINTTQYINCYGPYKLDAKFAFSDFKNWGHGHNEGFKQCIEECCGKFCVFDVGAHIGLVSLPMSQVVSGYVYAFEPAQANRSHLLSHIKRNRINNVIVQNVLVGSELKEQVDFFEQKQATGMNSRIIKKNSHLYQKTSHCQISLDHFCYEKKISPELIKIDVEGSEYDVILGAKHILAEIQPILYLSIHPKELVLMGRSVNSLISLLGELGYYAYTDEGRLVTEFGFSEYRFVKRK